MNVIEKYPLNTLGRDFVVGDIHGMFSLLQSELDKVNFNPEVDRLFAVGDLVDRGSESEKVEDWLRKPWFHSVRGNHEDMIMDHFMWRAVDMIANGANWWLDLETHHREWYIELFEKLPLVIEVETKSGKVGIVHAEYPYDDWNRLYTLTEHEATGGGFEGHVLWARYKMNSRDVSVVKNVNMIYVGHTPALKPEILGNTYYLDTGGVWTGNLTLLELL